tara:strand:+ start:136 stop:678 length:543 start_codon:yes stop_codon:yes gene_type:complete
MKLYELFWPVDMRKQVKRLREEGHLNEQAVKHFNQGSIYMLIAAITIFILTSSVNVFAAVSFFLLSVCFYCWLCRLSYKKNYAPYLNGRKHMAEIQEIFSYPGQGAWERKKIRLIDIESKRSLQIGPCSMRGWKIINNLQKNERIEVYSSKDKKYAMPDDLALKKMYSLKSCIIEKKNYA